MITRSTIALNNTRSFIEISPWTTIFTVKLADPRKFLPWQLYSPLSLYCTFRRANAPEPEPRASPNSGTSSLRHVRLGIGNPEMVHGTDRLWFSRTIITAGGLETILGSSREGKEWAEHQRAVVWSSRYWLHLIEPACQNAARLVKILSQTAR